MPESRSHSILIDGLSSRTDAPQVPELGASVVMETISYLDISRQGSCLRRRSGTNWLRRRPFRNWIDGS